jgi:hypothetical protein
LDSKLLKNNQNKQPADPRSLEAGRDGFWISAKTLSIVVMLLGFFAIVSWYLNSPAL